jgi:hypothetical protein
MVQYLIDHGADVTAKDATNKTALDLSREPCPGPGLKGNEQQKRACERLMTGRAATETVLVAAIMKAGLPVPPPAAQPTEPSRVQHRGIRNSCRAKRQSPTDGPRTSSPRGGKSSPRQNGIVTLSLKRVSIGLSWL